MLGDAVRSRRALAAETADRLRLAGEERDAEAARRVAEERLRIARDLHDTVAHSMATITVQAGSALHLLGSRRARRDETRTCAPPSPPSGRPARRRSVRCGPPWASSAAGRPRNRRACEAAGLDRLPALRDAVTAAGAPVTVSVEGEERPLPAGRGPCGLPHPAGVAHQRAAARRPGGPRPRSACATSQTTLAIRVTDDGTVPRPPRHVGHGLTGMAERAADRRHRRRGTGSAGSAARRRCPSAARPARGTARKAASRCWRGCRSPPWGRPDDPGSAG